MNKAMGDIIREAFGRSDLSMNEVCKRSGLSYASVHGLLTGSRGVTLATADRICHVLDLELRKRKGK